MKFIIGLLKSKTVWTNILGALVQVLNYNQGWIDPQIALGIQTIANILIRMITKKPIADK